MMDTMYEVPSEENVEKVVVTKEAVINDDVQPTIVYKENKYETQRRDVIFLRHLFFIANF